MNNDLLGISNVNLGILKSAFLTPNRENVLYTGTLSNEEVAKYMRDISTLTKSEKLEMITQKINDIYLGKYRDEGLLNKEESYIVLLLKSIPFSKDEADYYWKDRFESAIHNETKNVLIEVAAMHPLNNGKPGTEFQDRLIQAIELYNIEKDKGNNPIIYIPGSLHYVINPNNNTPQIDSQPLSEAGKEFLITHGIPEGAIRANVINLDIKGEDGVYNSGDECYVATQIARNENCGRIISVVSPVQIYRKALFYQEFGYNPEIYATGSEKIAHNYIGETFWSLYITYMNDQDWQTGFISYLTRKERDIDYPKRVKDYQDVIDEILKNGPAIPQNVFDQKKEWMKLYNSAKENMDFANANKENILIDFIRTDGKQDLELKRIEQLIQENGDVEITVMVGTDTDIKDILELIAKYPAIRIVTLDKRDKKDISKTFKNGNYKKFFGMYPSSISMKQSVEYIKEGIIPVVSSLPDKNPNYIENIASLFDEVMLPVKNREEEQELTD